MVDTSRIPDKPAISTFDDNLKLWATGSNGVDGPVRLADYDGSDRFKSKVKVAMEQSLKFRSGSPGADYTSYNIPLSMPQNLHTITDNNVIVPYYIPGPEGVESDRLKIAIKTADVTRHITVAESADDLLNGVVNKFFSEEKEAELTAATSDIAALATEVAGVETALSELDMDDVAETTTKKWFLDTEKTKLAGLNNYTDAQAIAALLAGFSAVAGGTVSGADSILAALQKHEYRLNTLTPFGGGVRTISTNDRVYASDFGKKLKIDGASVITLPQTSTEDIAAGFFCFFENIGSVDETFVKEGTNTLLGNTLAAPGAKGIIYKNSSTQWSIAGGTKLEAISRRKDIESPTVNVPYDVVPSLENNFTVTQITVTLGAGSCTIAPFKKVGGAGSELAMATSAPITITAGVTPQPFSVSVSSNNDFALGDELLLRVSAATSAARICAQFIGYRKTNVW